MIHINAKAIGIKTPIKVNESFENVKRAFKYQSDLLKVTAPKGKNSVDRLENYYDGQIKAVDMVMDYISDTLNLTDKQTKNLGEASFPKVRALSNQIITKMLHYDQGDNNPKTVKKSHPKKH